MKDYVTIINFINIDNIKSNHQSCDHNKLKYGTKIKETIIRDETSFGMYCAEEELGLADHSDGILILPTDTPIGVNYIEYAQLQDTIIEFPAEIAQNQNELIAKLMTILKKP